MMFVRNFRLFPAVKEFCKSVKIRRELCYEFGVFLLGFFWDSEHDVLHIYLL